MACSSPTSVRPDPVDIVTIGKLGFGIVGALELGAPELSLLDDHIMPISSSEDVRPHILTG